MKNIIQKTIFLLLLGGYCFSFARAYDDVTITVKRDGLYYQLGIEKTGARYARVCCYRYPDGRIVSNDVSGSISIPSWVSHDGKGYPVTGIGTVAFRNCCDLTSVEIPSSVTEIGTGAFEGCSGLTSVKVPSSVKLIEHDAFTGCGRLKTAGTIGSGCNIEFGWTTIPPRAFSDFSSLTSIEISLSVTSIGVSAFEGCSGLTSIEIPSSVTNIGDRAFWRCSSLKTLCYNATCASVPNYAFPLTLETVIIGNDVTSLPNGIPYSVLKMLTIGVNVTSVDADTITSKPIKTIWLPNTPPAGYQQVSGMVNYAANKQYEDLDNVKVYPYLSSMFTKDGATLIPVNPSERACDIIDYRADSAGVSVALDNGVEYKGIKMDVTNIGEYTFYNCVELDSIAFSPNTNLIGAYAFSGCANLKNVTLPVGLKKIGRNAFENCKKFTKVEIPQNVVLVSDYAFKGCTAVSKLTVADRITPVALCSNGNMALFADCPINNLYIGGNIVYDTSSDKGYSPFCRNTALRRVVVSGNADNIPANEFYGCSALRNVTIGNNVKAIGKEAFSDCTNMTTLISCATVPPICGNQALDDINKFNCTLQVPEWCEAAYQSADQWKEFFFIEGVNDIRRIFGNDAVTVDVYTLDGALLRKGMDATQIATELPRGLYVINGRKVVVK